MYNNNEGTKKHTQGGETVRTLRQLLSIEWMQYQEATQTKHIQEARAERVERYQTSYPLDAFEVDKHHAHGTEIHIIDAVGYIHIYNTKSKRYITILSARPAQIKRYYKDLNLRYSDAIAQAIKTAHARNEATNANNF